VPRPSERVSMVDAAGLTWRVGVYEPEQTVRVPLLLINGLGASLEIWQPFVSELPADLPVIRFDAPGVGLSEVPRRPMSLKGMARALDSLLERLDVEQVDVLGVSWGGLLAQHLAARSPERCRRLVLVSTVPCVGAHPARFAVARELLSRRRYVDPAYAVRVAGRLYGGAVRRQPELVHALHRGIAASPAGYLHQWLAGLSAAGPPFYPGIRQPTLILSGDDDPLIPLGNARMLRAAIPNSRLRIFSDGHLGLFTAATELAPLVDAFLLRDDYVEHGRLESAAYLAAATARGMLRGRSAPPRGGADKGAGQAA
jgi:poly(3-hydroxyalkanoate) depolymerase